MAKDLRDVAEGPRKGKGKGKGFWTLQKIFILFIFILGLVLGGFIMHQYIEPAITENRCADYNVLLAKNQQLDSISDTYYSCLTRSGVNPEDC